MRSRLVVSAFAIGGVAGFAALFAVACGVSDAAGAFAGDDAGAPSEGDGSTGDDGSQGNPPDGGPGGDDAGGDGGSLVDSAAPFILPSSILAVHASANLYDFRLCFGITNGAGTIVLAVPPYPDDPAHPMPETNYPGVAAGGAAMLPPLRIPAGNLVPYVVRAQALQQLGVVSTNANEPTCDQLICTGASCLSAQFDYYALPTTVLTNPGTTYVLAVEGCVAASVAAGSVVQCGGAYDPATGNLSAVLGSLAPSLPSTGTPPWTFQLAQLSPSFALDAGAASIAYVDPTSDASVSLTPFPAPVLSLPITMPLSEAGATAAYFAVTPSAGASVTQTLAAIQYFEQPASDPVAFFSAPATYFVAIVGDATDAAAPVNLADGGPNPAFDGHGLHVIAYPEQ